MSYQIDITRIEIVENESNAAVIEIEAIDSGSAQVTMNLMTDVDDWHALSQAVSQSLLLMQLKVPQ